MSSSKSILLQWLTNICTKTMPGWAGLGWAGLGWAGWAGGKVSPGRVTQHSGARVTGGRGRAAGDSRERGREGSGT